MVYTRLPFYSLPLDMSITTPPFAVVTLAPGQQTFNTIICPYTGQLKEIIHYLWPENASVYWELFRGVNPYGTLIATGNAAPYVYPDGTRANYFYKHSLNISCTAGDTYTVRITNTGAMNIDIPALRHVLFPLTGPVFGVPHDAYSYYPDHSMAPFVMSAESSVMGNQGVYWFGQPFFERDADGPTATRSIIGVNNISWMFTCIDTGGYFPFRLEGVIVPISTLASYPTSISVSVNEAEYVEGYEGNPYPILKPLDTVISSGAPTPLKCYHSGTEYRYFVIYRLPQPRLLWRFAVGFTTSASQTTWFGGMRGISTWATWSIFPSHGRGAWDRTSSGTWIYRNTVVRLVGLFGDYVIPGKRRVFYT